MNKKILIIGQNGLLGSSFIKYFKIKKLNFYSLRFETFLKKFNKNLIRYDIIINCTSNQKFISNSYQVKNDYDLIIAKKIVVAIRYHIYLFSRFPQIKVVQSNEKSISNPPIVGVPALSICELGPSFLITSDKLLLENFLIIYGPDIKEIVNAVIMLKIVLSVMYSKTKKLEFNLLK